MFEVMNALYGRLEVSPVAWNSFMETKEYISYAFGHQKLDIDPGLGPA